VFALPDESIRTKQHYKPPVCKSLERENATGKNYNHNEKIIIKNRKCFFTSVFFGLTSPNNLELCKGVRKPISVQQYTGVRHNPFNRNPVAVAVGYGCNHSIQPRPLVSLKTQKKFAIILHP
jgi:hypothetical protein